MAGIPEDRIGQQRGICKNAENENDQTQRYRRQECVRRHFMAAETKAGAKHPVLPMGVAGRSMELPNDHIRLRQLGRSVTQSDSYESKKGQLPDIGSWPFHYEALLFEDTINLLQGKNSNGLPA